LSGGSDRVSSGDLGIEKGKADYACALLEEMLGNRDAYFHGDELNSEGWKLFERLASIILEYKPYYAKRVKKLRKRPEYSEIAELLAEALSDICGAEGAVFKGAPANTYG
jgi:hypothetical protein